MAAWIQPLNDTDNSRRVEIKHPRLPFREPQRDRVLVEVSGRQRPLSYVGERKYDIWTIEPIHGFADRASAEELMNLLDAVYDEGDDRFILHIGTPVNGAMPIERTVVIDWSERFVSGGTETPLIATEVSS